MAAAMVFPQQTGSQAADSAATGPGTFLTSEERKSEERRWQDEQKRWASNGTPSKKATSSAPSSNTTCSTNPASNRRSHATLVASVTAAQAKAHAPTLDPASKQNNSPPTSNAPIGTALTTSAKTPLPSAPTSVPSAPPSDTSSTYAASVRSHSTNRSGTKGSGGDPTAWSDPTEDPQLDKNGAVHSYDGRDGPSALSVLFGSGSTEKREKRKKESKGTSTPTSAHSVTNAGGRLMGRLRRQKTGNGKSDDSS